MIDFVLAVLGVAATVYGTSAGAKLRGRSAFRSFRDGLGQTALVSDARLPAAAAALVVGEAGAVGLTIAALATILIGGATVLADVALASAALLALLLVAGVATVIRRGTNAKCACFGAGSDRPLGTAHLARNVSLVVVLLAGLAGSMLGHGRPGLAGAAVAIAAGAVTGLLLVRFDDIVALFAPMALPGIPAVAVATVARSPGGRTPAPPTESSRMLV